jgi:hypothetical protein
MTSVTTILKTKEEIYLVNEIFILVKQGKYLLEPLKILLY